MAGWNERRSDGGVSGALAYFLVIALVFVTGVLLVGRAIDQRLHELDCAVERASSLTIPKECR